MSLLSQVTSGKVQKPYFITIFGPEGTWKTTFGAESPDPIFACTEDGSNQMDVARLPKIESMDTLLAAVDELLSGKHKFKSFVIDSLDHLEPLIWEKVCKENKWANIEEPGFGKGYNIATKEWVELFRKLKALREKMNVILICHSQQRMCNDPLAPQPYERHELKLHKGAVALVKENCDAILFSTHDTTYKVDGQKKKAKAFGGEDKILLTEYRPHHDGKNRFGLDYQIKNSFESFHNAVLAGNPESANVLISQIEGLLPKLEDEELRSKASEKFAEAKKSGDVKSLISIMKRLKEVTRE